MGGLGVLGSSEDAGEQWGALRVLGGLGGVMGVSQGPGTSTVLEHPVVWEGWGGGWGIVVPGGAGGPGGQLALAQLICSSSQVEVGMAV